MSPSRPGSGVRIRGSARAAPPPARAGSAGRDTRGLIRQHQFNKVEILRNSNAVLPPSLHSSSFKYEFSNCRIPKSSPREVPSINILEFIQEFAKGEGMWSSSFSRARSKPISNKNITDSKSIEIDNYPDKNFYLVFDLETDGLIENERIPNILQVSWSLIDKSGYSYKRKTELVNNGDNLNKASSVNSIDIETLKLIGKPICEVLKELWRDLHDVSAIISHNTEFDISVLDHHMKECDLFFKFSSIPCLCTMKGGKNYLESINKEENIKFPKLTELYYRLFDKSITPKHQAIFDKVLTSRCFVFMLENDSHPITENEYWEKTKWPKFPYAPYD